jgi:hypothetical protein
VTKPTVLVTVMFLVASALEASGREKLPLRLVLVLGLRDRPSEVTTIDKVATYRYKHPEERLKVGDAPAGQWRVVARAEMMRNGHSRVSDCRMKHN